MARQNHRRVRVATRAGGLCSLVTACAALGTASALAGGVYTIGRSADAPSSLTFATLS
jgi:hypothetical protein